VATLLGGGLGNGVVSAGIALVGSLVLGGFFDVTTGTQLLELARPNHPLLQFVLRQAPGTYQHSLQVSNLAEQAAERLGADAMLTRVGALYHDCGKALHPEHFIENQAEGDNIHDRLTPEESAHLIIDHVTNGLVLARRHRLPRRVTAFVAEHHGTMLTIYQYRRAVEAAGGDASAVDESLFRYPGPRPQSVETALMLLADGVESKVRADRPATVDDIDRLVKKMIDERLALGQLDDCPLTMKDLQVVRESFVATLKGVFHSRLKYPEEKRAVRPD
jgi:putative nucleotidyltransferase with HDIG domain